MFTMVHLNCLSIQFFFQSTALGLTHTQSPTDMQGGELASWCEGLVDIACSSNFRTFPNTACDRWSKLMPVLSFTRQQGKCHAWFSMHSNDFPLQCFICKHAEFNYHSPDFLLLWRSLKHLKLTQALNLGCQPMLLVQSLHFNFHLN